MPVPEFLAVVAFAITGIARPAPPVDLPQAGYEPPPMVTGANTIVTSEALEPMLDDVIVVEVGRDRRAFRTGHVRGARFLDWDSIARETSSGVALPESAKLQDALADLGVGNDGPIVIYARNVLDATWAWFAFDSLGHGNRVAILDGGLLKWVREGRPVAGGDFVPRRAAFAVRPAPDTMIGLAELKLRLGDDWAERPLVVDARTTDEYRGEVRGAGVGRAGHIPGAFSISWTRNLEVIDDVPLFRMPESLRALYVPGATNGEVIVYCGTGREASMTYFVLRTLGLRARLYAGSFVEWSLTPDVPVARTARERVGAR